MSEKVTIKVERKELHLPTIALRGLVVFPNNLVHFEVGREKSIAAVEWAMANNSNVFLVAQKEMETSEPTQQDLYTYGVVAEVKQVLRVSDELVKVLVEGKYRAKLTAVSYTHLDVYKRQACCWALPHSSVSLVLTWAPVCWPLPVWWTSPRSSPLPSDVYKRQAWCRPAHVIGQHGQYTMRGRVAVLTQQAKWYRGVLLLSLIHI